MATRKRNSPTKQQSNNPNASKQQMVSVSHLITQGPLPNPEILDRYEQILTGAADRIMAMAEDEARHRHEMEKMVLEADINGMNADILDTKRGSMVWIDYRFNRYYIRFYCFNSWGSMGWRIYWRLWCCWARYSLYQRPKPK
jgi:hypothetical protein